MNAEKYTTCVLDCPDTCQVKVAVEEGKVIALDGGEDHPLTDGFICGKVRRFTRRQYSEERLRYPMKRTGPKGSGQFERISWDEAVATINSRFEMIAREYGSEAILPYHYGGSNGLLSDGFTDDLYFARLGASRQLKTLCAIPTSTAYKGMYGGMPGMALEDYVHARFILVWGTNPKNTSVHFMRKLKQAKKNGAFIAVIDPYNGFSSGEIDVHLPVRPGTDLPLALAMINWLRENNGLDHTFMERWAVDSEPLLAQAAEWSLARAAAVCRVDAGDIERLISTYAASDRAALRCGWGLERNRNGGQAAAAIMALPTLMGKFERFGGLTMSNSGAIKLDSARLLKMPAWETREINQTQLADVLCDPPEVPIKGLFVYNCNPIATVPDQNRLIEAMSEDSLFTVVFEQVFTDSALYADILLPAVTFLEGFDIRKGYGAFVVGGTRPVVVAEGEARTNHEVFSHLGRSMGFEDEAFTWDDETAFTKIAEALQLPDSTPVDLEKLRAGGIQHGFFDQGNPVAFESVFPATSDRKVHLTPSQLGPQPYVYQDLEVDGFPLALISPASGKLITSTFGEFNLPKLELTMHPDDAAARMLNQGDAVRVFNDLGEVVCDLVVSDRLAAGTVSMPKGAWRKASRNGKTSTALCPTTVNVVGGGACFNDARVEVEKAGA